MNTQFITTLPEDWKPIAETFSALGDETRQRILLLFEPGEELSIKTIASVFPLSRTAIVHHLSVLHRAGIVSARKAGKESLYRLHPDTIRTALTALDTYISEELL